MADHGRYLLDNAQREAGERFDALAQLFNPSTFRHLEQCGVAAGSSVWEVGAGGPSVPAWLAQRVGAQGRVVATDIDISWLEADEHRSYEVLLHDVAVDEPPGRDFDLIHARLVLVHLPARDPALAAMASVLRPGGWLLLEDADPMLQSLVCPDESGPDEQLANSLKRSFRSLLLQRGTDLAFGRTLPRRLRQAGLESVESDAYFPMGGPVAAELERATVEQIRDRLVDGGLATNADIDRHLANVASGRLDLATSPMISAWGRRPAT